MSGPGRGEQAACRSGPVGCTTSNPESPILHVGREGGLRGPRGGAGISEGATCSLPHRTRPENEPHGSIGHLLGLCDPAVRMRLPLRADRLDPGVSAPNRVAAEQMRRTAIPGSVGKALALLGRGAPSATPLLSAKRETYGLSNVYGTKGLPSRGD